MEIWWTLLFMGKVVLYYDILILTLFRPEQHWSLMPLHAVTSTVRPASFLYGNGAGYAGPMAMTFPQ